MFVPDCVGVETVEDVFVEVDASKVVFRGYVFFFRFVVADESDYVAVVVAQVCLSCDVVALCC